jgi:hypothetical protein
LERSIEEEKSFIPSSEIRREKVNYKSYREIMRRKLKIGEGKKFERCSSLKEKGRISNCPSLIFNEETSWSKGESVHFHLIGSLS